MICLNHVSIGCEQGWVRLGIYCYKSLSDGVKRIHDIAVETCAGMDATLPVVNSQAVVDFLLANMVPHTWFRIAAEKEISQFKV